MLKVLKAAQKNREIMRDEIMDLSIERKLLKNKKAEYDEICFTETGAK